jgi:glycosyltransferase involved in cell wall biosynthesis
VKIGIDLTSAAASTKTGIGRYVWNLADQLRRELVTSSDLELVFYIHSGSPYGSASSIARLRTFLGDARVRQWLPSRGYGLGLPMMARRDRIDLLHLPAAWAPRFKWVPTVVTFHDASWARLSRAGREIEGEKVRADVEHALSSADAVIAVSGTAAADLRSLYAMGDTQIKVIHHGVSQQMKEGATDASRVADALGLGPYILHLGTLQFRKNLEFLIEAFAVLRHEHAIPHQLVLAGPEGWGAEGIRAAVLKHNVEDRVVFPGYIDQADIPGLYAAADVFVYPSLYEGFGMPLIESMASGTVVVASNIAATREVADGAALYFDPESIESAVSVIGAALADEELRSDYAARGRRRAQKFTWENTARTTIACYRELLVDA